MYGKEKNEESMACFRNLYGIAVWHVNRCVGSKGCTFYMKNPGANVDGYKVTYKNYKTGKSTTKYASGYQSFSVALSGNCFYKVTIAPFVKVDNKIYAGTDSITTYIASQPKLQKKSNTKSSMTVKWAKTYGASSYSVYLKKPGASSFSKVATTTALSYTVKGMKIGSNYQIKVLANKKVEAKRISRKRTIIIPLNCIIRIDKQKNS